MSQAIAQRQGAVIGTRLSFSEFLLRARHRVQRTWQRTNQKPDTALMEQAEVEKLWWGHGTLPWERGEAPCRRHHVNWVLKDK